MLVESAFQALADEARGLMRRSGLRSVIERAVDAKYAGQSFELTIPLPGPRTPAAAIAEIFAREHERTYGHRADGTRCRSSIFALSPGSRATASRPPCRKSRPRRKTGSGASKRNAYFGQHYGTLATPVLDRLDLARAKPRCGPLLIDEYDATTLVPPGCSARLDDFDNIVIRIEA